MNSRTMIYIALLLLLLYPLLHSSCARQVAAGDADIEAYEPPPPLEEETIETGAAVEPSVYDLEDEMPEQDDVEPEDLEETIEPIPVDTVGVEEVVIPSKPEEVFGIGYRIQVFASSDLGAAESLKAKVAGETPLPVYIEFEGGYYKVRVGDFGTREEAAAERGRITRS